MSHQKVTSCWRACCLTSVTWQPGQSRAAATLEPLSTQPGLPWGCLAQAGWWVRGWGGVGGAESETGLLPAL